MSLIVVVLDVLIWIACHLTSRYGFGKGSEACLHRALCQHGFVVPTWKNLGWKADAKKFTGQTELYQLKRPTDGDGEIRACLALAVSQLRLERARLDQVRDQCAISAAAGL